MSAPARGSAPAVPEYAAVYVAPAGDADPAPSPDATAPASPLDLPRDTTPTYEPELLVSSIVLLALFQLPGVFAAVADRYGPHFSGVAGAAVSDVLRTVVTAPPVPRAGGVGGGRAWSPATGARETPSRPWARAGGRAPAPTTARCACA